MFAKLHAAAGNLQTVSVHIGSFGLSFVSYSLVCGLLNQLRRLLYEPAFSAGVPALCCLIAAPLHKLERVSKVGSSVASLVHGLICAMLVNRGGASVWADKGMLLLQARVAQD